MPKVDKVKRCKIILSTLSMEDAKVVLEQLIYFVLFVPGSQPELEARTFP